MSKKGTMVDRLEESIARLEAWREEQEEIHGGRITNKDLLKMVGRLALAICVVIYAAYVATVIWGWFLVPLGVAAIGIAQALGIMLLIHMMYFTPTTARIVIQPTNVINMRFAQATLSWGLAWIYQLFM